MMDISDMCCHAICHVDQLLMMSISIIYVGFLNVCKEVMVST